MRMRQGIVGVGRGAASLVFREAENLLPNPEAFNLWPNLSSAVVTADALANPDGGMNADLVTDNAVGTVGAVAVTTATLTLPTASVPYRYSIYCKPGTVPWVVLYSTSITGVAIQTWFNTATGATGTVGTNVTASGADAPINGWRRVWLTFTLATDLQGTFSIGMGSASNVATVLRNGTQTNNLWLAQLARI